ncbi:hypothetical protein BDB00DRAFT_883854 [Zychaea mexicana]|uniref:uncharacterized protein n=1 Tax=Zychaea mexicana TaxID=64656 RepID=UPI0022FEC853|nr:uncharacterized protein BDB00DRAFT_883854 [Zychaea mexicana]KAI9491246.1 hypothetical protein BDB00DRAFT_883854 [Zychaea mexicana]
MATSEDLVEKRIYIGGLFPSVNEQLLRDRFSRYGTISNITIAKDIEGNCRGFGHFNIKTMPKQWASCRFRFFFLVYLSGQADYTERKRKETEQQQRQRIEQASRNVFEAKDMTLVTDRVAKQKRGWRLGRYGRGIAIMRLKKPDGTELVFDPKLYSNNLTKLYDVGAKVKPVSRLSMYYGDERNDDHAAPIYEDEELLQSTNKDNDKRLAAMERRNQEEKQRQELLQRSLASVGNEERSNHVTFEASDDEKEQGTETESTKDTKEVRPAPRDAKWMFDSDSEEDESKFEIKINPVLEGEKGRELLELQSKFKGDDRFKLGEDFMEEEEKDTQAKERSKSEGEPEDEISKNLTDEKNQSMDLLRAMFGEEKVEKLLRTLRFLVNMFNSKPKETQWSTGARYDPDAEDADEYLRKPAEEARDESDKGLGDEEDDEVPVTAMPVVSTEKHFEVNVNMKPLFGAQEAEPFKLFGGDADTGAEENNEPSFGGMLGSSIDSENDSGAPSFASKPNKESHVGLGVLFFFHTSEPSLMKKSCFGYDPKGSFQRTDSEDYEAIWKEKRPEIGEILKKRQKQAVRRHKKLQTQGVK